MEALKLRRPAQFTLPPAVRRMTDKGRYVDIYCSLCCDAMVNSVGSGVGVGVADLEKLFI